MDLKTRLFFARRFAKLWLRLGRDLMRGRDPRRHTDVSHGAYQAYDDREIRAYLTASTRTIVNDRLDRASFRDIRDSYLAPVRTEIARLRDAGIAPVRVLEVGCGNGTNLKLLRDAFGAAVALTGIDISDERLHVGRGFWKDALDGVTLREASATDLTVFPDAAFDLVYTVHCIEQIPYEVPQVLREIARVTRHRAVFVEPVFEFANPAQRLYTIWADQLRTLLPEVRRSPLRVVSATPAPTLANPLNRTGVIVAEKPVA